MIPSTSGTSTTRTRTKSTTAAPRAVRGRRPGLISLHGVEGVPEQRRELRLGDAVQDPDQAGGHHGDQHPAGYVAAVATPSASAADGDGERGLQSDEEQLR